MEITAIKNLNDLPETDEVYIPFEPSTELARAWIDPEKDIPEPPRVLEIGGIVTLTAGNISTIIGKAKSKKTFLLMGLLSAVSSGTWGNLSGYCTNRSVLLFDTEQSLFHASKMVRACHKLGAGNIEAYSLRGYTPAQRVQIIEYAIYNTENLGFVAIDGQRDLLTRGINDEEEATAITSKFLRWTSDRDIHIMVVLHTNKGDANPRGHIGTELQNKSEAVISVAKSDTEPNVSIVIPEFCRNREFEPFAFTIDETGLPSPSDVPRTEIKQKNAPHLISNDLHFAVLGDIFRREQEYLYSDLWLSIKVEFGGHGVEFGNNRAKEFLRYYQLEGWISKNGKTYKYTRAVF